MWWWTSLAWAGICASYAPSEPIATVSGAPFAEASGIAVSRTRPGVLFLHADHGNDPIVLAVDRDGNVLGQHLLADATNEDWEDLAAAPCPDHGDCLYVGDIGDNARARAQIAVYVVREPKEGQDRVSSVRHYVGVYPDGPHDAEALMVNPCSGRIYVVTKEDDGYSTVFRFPFDPEGTATLEIVAKIQIDAPTLDSRRITGGDWDADGERVALRSGDRVFEWVTEPGDPDAHWQDPPQVLVGTTERQGEGVAYGLQGELVTVGEGQPIPLSEIVCDDYQPAEAPCAFPQTGGCGCDTGASPFSLAPALALLVARRRRAR